MHKLKETRFGL